MESLTSIASRQHQQPTDDDDRRRLDRLASFAAISDTGVAAKRRLLQRRHLAAVRRLSLPDTIYDIRKADTCVVGVRRRYCYGNFFRPSVRLFVCPSHW